MKIINYTRYCIQYICVILVMICHRGNYFSQDFWHVLIISLAGIGLILSIVYANWEAKQNNKKEK